MTAGTMHTVHAPRTLGWFVGACLVVLAAVGGLAMSPAAAAPPTRPGRSPAAIAVNGAPLATVLAAVKAADAPAVLVNVWATWCDPCREELPDLLRFYAENRGRGLRLIMVSADEVEQMPNVGTVLAAATAAAGLESPGDLIAFIKLGDDTAFVNGFDRGWSGALPATFLFDRQGRRIHSWLGPVTRATLQGKVLPLLTGAPTKVKPSLPSPNPDPPRRQQQ